MKRSHKLYLWSIVLMLFTVLFIESAFNGVTLSIICGTVLFTAAILFGVKAQTVENAGR